MTHARTAGCRGRGAVRAVGGPVMRSGRPGRRVSELAFSASGAAYPNRSGQYARCNLMLRAANSCEPVPQSARGRRGTSMQGAGPRRQRHKSASSGLAQAWESNPRQTVYETVALPTELTCWWRETASSCGTRMRNFQRERARRNSRVRTADTIPVSDLGTALLFQATPNPCGISSPKTTRPRQESQPGSLARVPGGLR